MSVARSSGDDGTGTDFSSSRRLSSASAIKSSFLSGLLLILALELRENFGQESAAAVSTSTTTSNTMTHVLIPSSFLFLQAPLPMFHLETVGTMAEIRRYKQTVAQFAQFSSRMPMHPSKEGG